MYRGYDIRPFPGIPGVVTIFGQDEEPIEVSIDEAQARTVIDSWMEAV